MEIIDEKWEAREWPERKKEKGAARIEVGDEAGRVIDPKTQPDPTCIMLNPIALPLPKAAASQAN
ncbi:hypothetical protein SCA6_013634 [Theobroma cacao]